MARSNVDDRTGIAAGSPIPIDLMKSLTEKLNLRDLTVAYGMSACLSLAPLLQSGLTIE